MACKPPIRVVELAHDRPFSTNGNDTNYIYIDVLPDHLRNIGPFLAAITVHAQLKNKTANFEFEVQGQWSYDGETWTPFANALAGPITADGQTVSSKYTTASDFGLFIRIRVGVKPTTGTAIESGLISLTASFELLS